MVAIVFAFKEMLRHFLNKKLHCNFFVHKGKMQSEKLTGALRGVAPYGNAALLRKLAGILQNANTEFKIYSIV